jgi:arylsulfatase A-like enzyme
LVQHAHRPNSLDLFKYADDPKIPVTNNVEVEEWELYNLNEDFNELINLAKKYPEKLNELKAAVEADAEKYQIYPLIDRVYFLKKLGTVSNKP